MRLLILFMALVSVSMAALTATPERCCLPDTFTAVALSTARQRLMHYTSIDFREYNQVLTYSFEGLDDWFVLIDFTTDVQYHVDKLNCTYRHEAASHLLKKCIHQNDVFVGSYKLGDSSEKINFWKSEDPDQKSIVVRGVSAKGCALQILAGDSIEWNYPLSELFFDVIPDFDNTVLFKRANEMVKGCTETDQSAFR